jgi:hypothetical protein
MHPSGGGSKGRDKRPGFDRLRTRRERPPSSASEQRDELAALHASTLLHARTLSS